MTHRFSLAALLAALPLAAPVATFAQTAPAPKAAPAKVALIGGVYSGAIRPSPVVSLTLMFRIGGTDAEPTATLEVPEQTTQKIAVAKTTIKGDTVTFALPQIGASFAGKRSADGATITGTFTQSGRDLSLTLTRTEKPVVLSRPQTPVPPFPYQTIEVSYPNPKAKGVTLAGTLTVPEGAGAFPVVLLITGSGAQDRDETIAAHKPFALIADYLGRRKIASLRVDDRGVGKSTGTFAAATTDDFADDVRAGVAFLRERPEVDAKRIGLIGHSEGGVIAPMVAASDPDVAFIVLLAGTGVSGNAVMEEQQRAIITAMGLGADAVAANAKISRVGMTAIKNARDAADARVQVDKAIMEETKNLPEAGREKAVKQMKQAFYPWCSAWFIRFASLDPREYLARVRCPVLALNGSRDTQVIAAQNLPAIESALKNGGNRFVTVRELPGLNHLFQTATTGSPAEYPVITQTIAPEVLLAMGDWIVQQSKP